jgi:hypothetical protein
VDQPFAVAPAGEFFNAPTRRVSKGGGVRPLDTIDDVNSDVVISNRNGSSAWVA